MNRDKKIGEDLWNATAKHFRLQTKQQLLTYIKYK